jgi:hypothetical protein
MKFLKLKEYCVGQEGGKCRHHSFLSSHSGPIAGSESSPVLKADASMTGNIARPYLGGLRALAPAKLGVTAHRSAPSPDPRRLAKAPAAGHPLPLERAWESRFRSSSLGGSWESRFPAINPRRGRGIASGGRGQVILSMGRRTHDPMIQPSMARPQEEGRATSDS